MIPLKDSIPNVYRPYTVIGLIGVNALIFLYTISLSPEQLNRVFHLYGLVPARFTQPEWAAWMGYPEVGFYTLITYMFLHGGFWHFIINSWMLWIFAVNIEYVMGSLRFLLFYIVCGVAALGAHMIFNLSSPVPVVGASGAIAGVMGAYFLLYPHSWVVTFIPPIFVIQIPAVIFLGLWFIIQVVSAIWADIIASGSGVAWWAHAGGFLAGILLLSLFKDNKRCYYCFQAQRKKDEFYL
ncbi:rhomboid family intramembrane serine protease [Desulfonatronospira sp.]|uniref:rhomboid family intramembrane serine protease n=1 Tax=Desulfonatronospira sp. TaxID=1962951 RepID=UPI0025BF72BF|nr:rhomboid family intramembrane serine protease [Desulfonatronospira sp.]